MLPTLSQNDVYGVAPVAAAVSNTPRGATSLLDQLRHVARASRCKCHVDMFGACAALSNTGDSEAHAASDLLVRCLAQALGRRPILYREGEAEMSFDEAWLMTLARCLREGDTASVAFLLRSRVPVHARRNLVFLLRMVVDENTPV